MQTRSEKTRSLGLVRGGGGGTLRWLGLIVYALLWGWLEFTLLASGAWIAASVLGIALFAVGRLPALVAGPRLCVVGGGAAIVAAAAWVTGPLLDAGGQGGDLSGSAAVAAALFLLPTLLAARQQEEAAAPSLGPVGFVFGFAPVFVGAVLGGGGLAPVSGGFAQQSVWTGQILLLLGSVPFAVVAAWGRVVDARIAAALVLGAGAQLVVGALDPTSVRVPAALAAGLYAIGWAGVGVSLLRRRGAHLDRPGEPGDPRSTGRAVPEPPRKGKRPHRVRRPRN
jgi:hypothetical protein